MATASSATSSSFALRATSSSFAVTSSYLAGGSATYVQSYNTSGQSVTANSTTAVVTNWTPSIAQNAGEWNNTTGVFTATKKGTYLVSAQIVFAQTVVNAIGDEFNVSISKNNNYLAVSFHFAQTTTSMFRPAGPISTIVSVVPGDTLTVRAYQASGASRSLTTTAYSNLITIQELPSRITR